MRLHLLHHLGDQKGFQLLEKGSSLQGSSWRRRYSGPMTWVMFRRCKWIDIARREFFRITWEVRCVRRRTFLEWSWAPSWPARGHQNHSFGKAGLPSILGPRTASAAPNSQTAEFFPATEFCLSFRWNFGCLVFSQGCCRWHLQRPKSGSCRVPGDVLKQMGKRSWILRCSTQRCQCWCQRHSWKLVESWGVCANYPL